MAELIKKSELIAEIKNTMSQGTSRGVFLALIDDAPTTTEAEIRAKAIDEFAEKMKWEIKNSIGISKRVADFTRAVIDMVAEQLKEE